MKDIKKIISQLNITSWLRFLNKKYDLLISMFLTMLSGSAFATDPGDDPFPKVDVGNGDVVKVVGTHMETSMKYAMIGGGIIMMLVGIGVIMHRLREDSATKETGSFLTTLIIAGLSITIGIVLIAIGWGAASYQLTS